MLSSRAGSAIFIDLPEREHAIFVHALKEARAITWNASIPGQEVALELTFLDDDSRVFHGYQAMNIWIALGLADYRTDGDHVPIEVVTPFGRRPIME